MELLNTTSNNIDYKKKSNEKIKLFSFLNNHKATDKKYTHISAFYPKGSYFIDYTNQEISDTFWKLYNDAIKTNQNIYLIEKTEHISPIRIDIDFKINNTKCEDKDKKEKGKGDGHFYTQKSVIEFISLIRNILLGSLAPKCLKKFHCVLMEKKSWSIKNKDEIGDGFHLIFPDIIVPLEYQHFLRLKVINNENKLSHIFSDVGYTNTWDQIYDSQVINRGWTMYGSRGKEGGALYNVTSIYELHKCIFVDGCIQFRDIKDEYNNENISKYLSIRKLTDHNKNTFGFVSSEAEFEYDSLMMTEGKKYIKSTDNIKRRQKNSIGHSEIMLPDRLGTIRKLIKILNPDRANNYDTWIKVCWAMYNTDSVELYDDFLEFSKLCPSKFNEETCYEYWNRTRNVYVGGGGNNNNNITSDNYDYLSVASIYYWAKEDNPKLYNEIISMDIINIIKKLNDTPSHIAGEIMFRLYGSNHKYGTSFRGDNDVWYQFYNHTWHEIYNNVDLRKEIYHSIRVKYEEYAMYLYNQIQNGKNEQKNKKIYEKFLKKQNAYNGGNEIAKKSNNNNKKKGKNNGNGNGNANGNGDDDVDGGEEEMVGVEGDISNFEKIITDYGKCLQIIKQLQTTPFMNNLMIESQMHFNDSKIGSKMNKNPYLIAFNNGIYNLQTFKFKCGEPEDYVSLSTGVDYIPYDSPGNIYKDDILQFIRDIQPNPEMQLYLLQILSTCLFGINKEQKIYFLSGSGSNGKSRIVDLLKSSFGEYYLSANIALITQKRGAAAGANAALMDFIDKRISIFTEPNEGEQIQTGIIKELSGGDEQKSRGLYQRNQTSFTVHSKIFLQCNDIPPPNNFGDAEARRFRVVNFPVKFTENPNSNDIYEKKMDPTIIERMKLWGPCFMSLLIKTYKDLIEIYKDRIHEPDEVLEYTRQYNLETNKWEQFIEEYFEVSDDIESRIDTNDIYVNTFKHWHKEYKPNEKVPAKDTFYKFLKKKYKKQFVAYQNILKGYKIKGRDNNNDEEVNDNIEVE